MCFLVVVQHLQQEPASSAGQAEAGAERGAERAVKEEMGLAEREREQEEGREGARIRPTLGGVGREQELLLAASASAAVAGLVGWLARSWFG